MDCFEVFLGCAGVEEDNSVGGFDPVGLAKLLERANARGGFGADWDSFGSDSEAHPVLETGFVNSDGCAAALPDGIENHEVAHRNRDADATGDGMGVGKNLGEAFPL